MSDQHYTNDNCEAKLKLAQDQAALLLKERDDNVQSAQTCKQELLSASEIADQVETCNVELITNQEMVAHLNNKLTTEMGNSEKYEAMVHDLQTELDSKKLQEQEISKSAEEINELKDTVSKLEIDAQGAQVCEDKLSTVSQKLSGIEMKLEVASVDIDLYKKNLKVCEDDLVIYKKNEGDCRGQLKDTSDQCNNRARQLQRAVDTLKLENLALNKENEEATVAISNLKMESVQLPDTDFLPREILERVYAVSRAYLPEGLEARSLELAYESQIRLSEIMGTTKDAMKSYLYDGYSHSKVAAEVSSAYVRTVSRKLAEAPQTEKVMDTVGPYMDKITEKYETVLAKVPYPYIEDNVMQGVDTVKRGLTRTVSKLPDLDNVQKTVSDTAGSLVKSVRQTTLGSRLVPSSTLDATMMLFLLILCYSVFTSLFKTTILIGSLIYRLVCLGCWSFKALTCLFWRTIVGTIRFVLSVVLFPFKIFKIFQLPIRLVQFMMSKIKPEDSKKNGKSKGRASDSKSTTPTSPPVANVPKKKGKKNK